MGYKDWMPERRGKKLEFSETLRGKTVYVAGCRQNERGIHGAWSGIQSAVVP
jgi:hypothetical protein